MREGFDIWDFTLSEADRKSLEQMDLGYSEILSCGNPSTARIFIEHGKGKRK